MFDRLASAEPGSVSCTATQESLLLQTYKVQLPQQLPTDNAFSGVIDATALAILKLCKPGLLDHHTPISIEGDGNCLFRAVSRALYGTKTHLLLRLLTSLEIAQNPDHYKVQRADIEETTNYYELLLSTCKPGVYMSLSHIYALSAQCSHHVPPPFNR